MRDSAKTFEDFVVGQRVHQFVLAVYAFSTSRRAHEGGPFAFALADKPCYIHPYSGSAMLW